MELQAVVQIGSCTDRKESFGSAFPWLRYFALSNLHIADPSHQPVAGHGMLANNQ